MVCVDQFAVEIHASELAQCPGMAYMYSITCTLWDGLGCPVLMSIIVPAPSFQAMRSGRPPSAAEAPRSVKWFWPSVNTANPCSSH